MWGFKVWTTGPVERIEQSDGTVLYKNLYIEEEPYIPVFAKVEEVTENTPNLVLKVTPIG